jgi:hypothetical protein
MAQPNENRPDFASLFANPTIERMLDGLTDAQFEDFVGYAFHQAGYFVEDTALQHGPRLESYSQGQQGQEHCMAILRDLESSMSEW